MFGIYSHWINQGRLQLEALGYSADGVPPFIALTRDATAARFPSGASALVATRIAKTREACTTLGYRLVRLWALAVRFGDVELQNTITDELAKCFIDATFPFYLDASAMSITNKTSWPGCPLRCLCIEWADTSRAGFELRTNSLPTWLTSGLMLLKMRRAGGELKDDPREEVPKKKERYHVHQAVEA